MDRNCSFTSSHVLDDILARIHFAGVHGLGLS